MPPVSPVCIDMVKKFLAKDTKMRPTGPELLKHPWLKDEEQEKKNEEMKAEQEQKKVTEKELKNAEGMRQDVPQTLALRRMELMKRLDKVLL